MYFAHMFCYGHDNNMVGITGIRGCMGVIYIGQASIYAIHIPDTGRDDNLAGGKAFVTWVKGQEQVSKGQGYLFAFANGTNRSASGKNYTSADEEVLAIKKGLKSPPTALYRIMKHLGPGSGGAQADSVAIMLERIHASEQNPSGCLIWYKRNDAITWVSGGSRESGQYQVKQAYQGDKAPSDLEAHWWRMDSDNCTITTI